MKWQLLFGYWGVTPMFPIGDNCNYAAFAQPASWYTWQCYMVGYYECTLRFRFLVARLLEVTAHWYQSSERI